MSTFVQLTKLLFITKLFWSQRGILNLQQAWQRVLANNAVLLWHTTCDGTSSAHATASSQNCLCDAIYSLLHFTWTCRINDRQKLCQKVGLWLLALYTYCIFLQYSRCGNVQELECADKYYVGESTANVERTQSTVTNRDKLLQRLILASLKAETEACIVYWRTHRTHWRISHLIGYESFITFDKSSYTFHKCPAFADLKFTRDRGEKTSTTSFTIAASKRCFWCLPWQALDWLWWTKFQ